MPKPRAKLALGFYEDENVAWPGVYSIVCIPSNRAFFSQAEEMWLTLRSTFEILESGECENKELQGDWDRLGSSQFEFRLVALDPSLNTSEKRQVVLEEAKKNWSGAFY